ncbi:putative ribosome-binding factor A, mitochondrial isoform X2 [Nasonia vitripennis]|uniref:Ribosome-binding factor A, mitochondrial n=1 Tax=Nasonia vitripennis TaxID=7425 RepID=A0A7M7G4H0_NASVI|nr:putative ribosome-binding factor A, mitochondrial isoform X2 [Nasonia vitripennis]
MQSRGICTCARLSSMQLGRIVNKVMSSDRTKKSRYKVPANAPHMPQIQPNFGPTSKTSKTTHKNRRVTVLNKVFMKYITDLMASGEVAAQLIGRGIEVSHVSVTPDFKLVNVFWFAQNEIDANESTERILKRAAGQLQHELSQLRVIGIVPPINFVKNRLHSAVKEVESRLATVDFGEDFVPSAYIKSQIRPPVLQMSLSPEIKAKLSALDSNSNNQEEETVEEEEEIYEIKIPEMKQDVMGFNHSAIMKRIKASLNKTKLAEQRVIVDIPQEPQGNSQVSPADVATFLDNKEQQILFNDFLKKRMVEEKRRLQSISLLEAKLEEEEEWVEQMREPCDIDDYDINEDDYRDNP